MAETLKKKKRLEAKQIVKDAKNVPCMDCGKTYPHYVLDLDHMDGYIKIDKVSSIASRGTIEQTKEEIKKCQVVCANCHRLRTAKQFPYNNKSGPRYTLFREILDKLKSAPCVECGNIFLPIQMDFDHIKGNKIDKISNMLRDGCEIKLFIEEVKKCENVCVNCHRVRTFTNERNSNYPSNYDYDTIEQYMTKEAEEIKNRQEVFIHGMRGTKEYMAWNSMKNRCYNKNNAKYKNIGAKGIIVFDEWKEDFLSFYKYIGICPNKTFVLLRIDTSKNYEPDNIKWGSSKEAANREMIRGHEINITIDGKTKTLTNWLKEHKIKRASVNSRIGRLIAENKIQKSKNIDLSNHKEVFDVVKRGNKINEKIVSSIKKDLADGISYDIIKTKYSISLSSVYDIKNSRCWKDIK